MEFRDLEIISEIAKFENLSKASDNLHISQPTLSKRVKHIESELGYLLFTRYNHGVKLTKAGEIFLEYSQRAQQILVEGFKKAKLASKESTLKIAAPVSLATHVFPKIVPILEQKSIQYELFHYHSHELWELIMNNVIDIGILEEDVPKYSVETFHLYKDPIVLCCSNNDLHEKLKEINFSDLQQYKLILYSWGKDFEKLSSYLDSHFDQQQNCKRVTPIELVKNLVIYNNYFAFLPFSSIHQELQDKKIKIITTNPKNDWHYSVCLAFNRNLKNPDYLNLFIKKLAEKPNE